MDKDKIFAFVFMPFDDAFLDVYKMGITPIVELLAKAALVGNRV